MSDFRTKLLGLAALATAFAGMSYGQTIGACLEPAVTNGPVTGAPINPSLRAEGETELLADFGAGTVVGNAACTSSAATASAIVVVNVSLPVTSKPQPFPATTTEAALSITTGAGTTVYYGTVSGTSVTFTGVSLPAGNFSLQVSNIRVNAAGASAPQVTENVLISTTGGNFSLTSAAAYQAGYILTSLGGAAISGAGVTNYTACTGNVYGAVGTPTASFTVSFKELFGGAFKTQGNAGGNASEQGSYSPGGTTTIGTATTPTELAVTLANVPSAATVYVPITITSSGGSTLEIFNAVPITTPASVAGITGGAVGYTPVSGTVTITYSVTGSLASVGAQTFNVPVYVALAANAASQQTAITAAVAYAPQAAVTGPAAAVPTFAVSTATTANGSTISNCSTTLLFPYVTNATGFETGIAVANTSTDNLGTSAKVPSVATPTNGTCTINFYGNAAQPTATVTPTLGAYTAAAPTVVPIYANILTSMVGSSGFSGYAIASCNFLNAHGFAFITDTTGTFSGTEGYLATVVPSNRAENGETSLNVSLSIPTGGTTIGAATTISGTVTTGTGNIIGNTGQ